MSEKDEQKNPYSPILEPFKWLWWQITQKGRIGGDE